ncbi:MAG TPA: thioredoxin family protein [Candidatus Omnitrophota bacterium]|nr:thioredoxin family protein [Candidatus Omnitrophota bacterium]HPD85535.1 thioredoxin family protein [Candidatus Omnitrophota bacterium]HRZ04425.1 thioredoxin family protein [Candidatus Omnitrophota bacterium]
MVKIDILIKPGEKCEHIERIILMAAQFQKMEVKITRTSNFAAYAQCAINPSQTPIIIINGNVEFAGRSPEPEILRRKLAEIKSYTP